MRHPDEFISRVCSDKGVSPAELLAILIENMASSHLANAGVNSHVPEDQRGNVYSEVEGYRHMHPEPKPVPPSLIAAVDLVLEIRQAMQEHNTALVPPEHPYRAHAERYTLALRSLRLLLRDVMNDAENSGIRAMLRMEDEARKRRERETGDDSSD